MKREAGRSMKIKYSMKSLKKFLANAFSGGNPEKILEDVHCELTRRNFAVERYEDVSGMGIRGSLDIYPSVQVNVYIPFTSAWELQALLFFEEDDKLELVSQVPDLKEKILLRRYSLPINPREIARALSTDALLLGALLATILKRQEIEARHE